MAVLFEIPIDLNRSLFYFFFHCCCLTFETVEKIPKTIKSQYAWHFHLSGLAHTGPNSTLANKCPEITRNFILLKASLANTGVCISWFLKFSGHNAFVGS